MSLRTKEGPGMKMRKWSVLAAFCGVFLFSCAVGVTGAEAGRDHWGFSLGHGGASFHYGRGHGGHHGGYYRHGYHGGFYGHGHYRPHFYGYGYYPRVYYHSYYPVYGWGGCGWY